MSNTDLHGAMPELPEAAALPPLPVNLPMPPHYRPQDYIYSAADMQSYARAAIEQAALFTQPAAPMQPQAAITLVKHQADDDGLWCIAQTAPEAMLQAALRRLHAAIEYDAKEYTRAAIEQAAGTVPEGWKLVPVEPDSNMINSAPDAWHSWKSRDNGGSIQQLGMLMWERYLAASPAPPKQQPVHLGSGECGGVPLTPPHALRLKVCLLDGHDPFVFHVDGMMTARVLSGIDDELTANKDDIFKDGQGDYEFTAIHFNGQYGFEGRCELAPGWEFEQIGFVSLDKTLDALDAPTSRPSAPTGQINPDSAGMEGGVHGNK